MTRGLQKSMTEKVEKYLHTSILSNPTAYIDIPKVEKHLFDKQV